ncbi:MULTISPECIES: acetate kinase [Cyanophyceae]|uniref:acetate kinase n=1 Tax=Cyanophyceae TaxID=3028117 RepID=UPI0016893F13|nr:MULTISPECIES: acetate kinase [Cyanophyceae]MBD1916110.1 acetate kinase [Phormidium sp. FACHB-77]MBD2031621.1 acetate kinase [Phormidium sp. FACHB-322]MBD2052752.1 acetate kinase [Leptolyngbya sp. FACHB-60]
MKILVLNAGSSSHKSCLFDLSQGAEGAAPHPLWRAALDWTHQQGKVELSASGAGESIQQVLSITDEAEGIAAMVKTLVDGPTQVLGELAEIAAVGHRIVHGGRHYQQPVVVDDEVKATIQSLIPLAPAHNPANLQGIEAIAQSLGTIPQVAVFDTAFHSHMPEAAATYPGPYAWVEQGIRRYGFHGISHQYVAQRAAAMMGQDLTSLKLLTCHLGNGCSLAAVKNGVCVDTTMGFTPLDGLMMGSRSGSVDPGILIYLMRQEGYTADQLDRLLNKESGLSGLSGRSNDMRAVAEAMEQGDAKAKLAIEVFIHRLRREMGGMIASLGGLDGVVFTAGVGENSPLVWQQACEPFEFLGLRLKDELSRDEADQDIAAADSAVRVLVVHTQEEWAIAQACLSLLQPNHA